MNTILLTGFEPYGETPVNPAERVARMLHDRVIEGACVQSRIVPNSFFLCIDAVRQAIAELQPEAVVMMGEYPGRAMVTVERLAQNLNDGTRYGLLDNAGRSMQDELTAPGGHAAYFSTLPIRAMVAAMRANGVPADISDCAGTFCCNHLMYGVLHHLANEGAPIRAGWIHLPQLPEVAARPENLGVPSMSADTAALGVEAGLAAILCHPVDSTEPSPSRLQI